MTNLPTSILFPTMAVGSLPRPRWVQEVIEQRRAGHISEREADALLDAAIPAAIAMQQRAGLDFISDGEWRRESYIKVFSEAVDGFEQNLLVFGKELKTTLRYPAAVAKLSPRRPLTVDATAFLAKHAQAKLNVTLPSPHTISHRMWSSQHSTDVYPTRESFVNACVPIIRQEIQQLVQLGVQAVQLDDPCLLMLIDPAYRERFDITDLHHEIDVSVQSINEAIAGIENVFFSFHLCRAHHNRTHAVKGPYDLIMGDLARINVDRFAMEFATPDAEGIEVLKDFPGDKILGLGVIDQTDKHVETPQEVVDRVEAAMQYVPKERITLNTDCGFAPSNTNPMDFDEAYLKLKAMCQGAALLRQKYG